MAIKDMFAYLNYVEGIIEYVSYPSLPERMTKV